MPRPTCRFPRLRGRRTRRQPDRVHRPRTNMVERDCPRRQRPAQGRRRPTPPDQRRRHAARPPRIATPRPGRHHPAVRTWPADEYTRVTLELDSELKAEQFTLENPHRLVVDIEGLTINAALNDLVSKVRPDDPYIQSLRVAQNRPNVVRMVFDLKQAVAPQVFTLARCRLSVPPGAGPVSRCRAGSADRGDQQAGRSRRRRSAGPHPGRHPAQSRQQEQPAARAAAGARPAARRADSDARRRPPPPDAASSAC